MFKFLKKLFCKPKKLEEKSEFRPEEPKAEVPPQPEAPKPPEESPPGEGQGPGTCGTI